MLKYVISYDELRINVYVCLRINEFNVYNTTLKNIELERRTCGATLQ